MKHEDDDFREEEFFDNVNNIEVVKKNKAALVIQKYWRLKLLASSSTKQLQNDNNNEQMTISLNIFLLSNSISNHEQVELVLSADMTCKQLYENITDYIVLNFPGVIIHNIENDINNVDDINNVEQNNNLRLIVSGQVIDATSEDLFRTKLQRISNVSKVPLIATVRLPSEIIGDSNNNHNDYTGRYHLNSSYLPSENSSLLEFSQSDFNLVQTSTYGSSEDSDQDYFPANAQCQRITAAVHIIDRTDPTFLLLALIGISLLIMRFLLSGELSSVFFMNCSMTIWSFCFLMSVLKRLDQYT